jgi:uncharacterized protein (DUF362 family)
MIFLKKQVKMSPKNDSTLTRRQFVARLVKAGASIAAAGIISSIAYDKKGPAAQTQADMVTLPDFSIPREDGKIISIVKGPDRIKAVDKAIDLLGGIERFVKKGDTVVIKPNVAFASVPALGATTNPQLVARLVELCYARGQAEKVYVTDNPINAPASCFAISGIAKAVAQAGGIVFLPKDSSFKPTTLKTGRLIKSWPVLYEPLAKADKLIGIAPVKDHSRAMASMSMKNWYGLLGGRRNVFHQDINTIIAELAMLVKPTLVILDGTEVMMTNGPTGGSFSDLKRTDTIIASCDQVAADAFGCSLLGLKPENLPYLAKAQTAGAGTTDYMSLKPLKADII